jgi:integrase
LVTKLYELADSDLKLFMKVCDATGHRSKSVRHLHWNDIRWTDGQIVWRGDSDKAGTEHETPLPEQLRQDLVQARDDQQRAGRTAKQLKSGFIFPGHTDERPATASHFTKCFAKLKNTSGHEFQDRAGFHCFRRLFANELKGENAKVVARLGGWADTQMLLNVYTEPSKEEERVALQRRRAS